MNDSLLVKNLNEAMQLSISPQSGGEELIQFLSAHINQLINSDFQQLVNLLYRLDVSEEKLRDCLINGPAAQDTSLLIASMIIERQEQKIKSRQQFRQQDQSVDEEESW